MIKQKILTIGEKKVNFYCEDVKGYNDLFVQGDMIITKETTLQKCNACGCSFYTKEIIHTCPICGYEKFGQKK